MELLFAYGSLLLKTGNMQVDKAMSQAGEILGRGFIRARLYDLGQYPGALELAGTKEGAEPEARVWGRLLALRDPAAFFAIVDEYEGYFRERPQDSEFIRVETLVFLPETSKSYTSHVYYYNQSVQGKEAILNGDYLAFRQSKERSR